MNPEDEYSRARTLDVAQVPGTSSNPASLVHVARSAVEAGDYSAAVRLYREAYRQGQGNAAILNELGHTLSAMGAHDEAVEAFRTAIGMETAATGDDGTRKPEKDATTSAASRLKVRLDAMQGLGNALIALDRPTQAVSQFEAILNLAEQPRAYNGLGVAHDMLGDHELAQAYYRTGLKIDPRNLGLLNNLGLSLAVTGAFEEAISVLRRAALDRRATSRQRLNLALAYGLAGKSEAAAEISRIDLDEAAVRGNLAYYRMLRALNDRKAMISALGAHGVLPGRQAPRTRTSTALPALPLPRRPGSGSGVAGSVPVPGTSRPLPLRPQATR